MIIAIHPDKNGSESYSDKWAKFLGLKNIDIKWVDLTKPDALEQVKGCDGVMWRWVHTPCDKIKAPQILYTIEKYLGISVYPDHNTCWHYDNKVAQYYMLSALGVPLPRSWIFWDKISAIEWAKKTQYPKVFKLSSGAASSNVIKVTSEAHALRLIETMMNKGIFPMTTALKKERIPWNLSKVKAALSRLKHGLFYGTTSVYPPLPPVWWQPERGYIYFQEFIPENKYDTRIAVIGDRAFGFRRFNRQNDFRASGSKNFDTDHTKVDINCVKMAFNISKKLKFQSMAYDFLLKKDQPIVVEISYTWPDRVCGEICDGHWDSNFNWIPGKMWPEEAQVDDFIKYITESGKK